MKLSRLKELRPDVWEEAKRQTIEQECEEKWDYYVRIDVDISMAFTWINSDQKDKPWQNIYYFEDFTLYDEWAASQVKQPEPESKKDLDYWRYQFAGMAMHGILSIDRIMRNDKELLYNESLAIADGLIKELQK
jgi:hypothetical protein